jgi:shikimate dehydrogenase
MITGKAQKAGVMGWPIAHSRSPQLHNYWLHQYGIDGAYLPFAIEPRYVEKALRALPLLGFRGCNVTIPHKEAALRAVDEVEPLAARIGAVNTVVVRDDQSLLGSNSDAFGFAESIRDARPGWRADKGPALVIGAGGAARAIVVALQQEGAPEIRIVNRSAERAEALAAEFGLSFVRWDTRAEAVRGATIVVNSTSQGMEGEMPLDLPLDALPKDAVVFDSVYVPLETPLLAAARRRGNPAIDGLGMLLHQGRPGFAVWFGVEPKVTAELRQAIEATL